MKKEVIERVTSVLSIVAQSFVIITVIVTVLLFEHRLIICRSYGLPVIYNSLDILSALPIVLAIIFIIFLYIVTNSPISGDMEVILSRFSYHEEKISIDDINNYLKEQEYTWNSHDPYSIMIEYGMRYLSRLKKKKEKMIEGEGNETKNEKEIKHQHEPKKKITFGTKYYMYGLAVIILFQGGCFLYISDNIQNIERKMGDNLILLTMLLLIIFFALEVRLAKIIIKYIKRDILLYKTSKTDSDGHNENIDLRQIINHIRKMCLYFVLLIMIALSVDILSVDGIRIPLTKHYSLVQITSDTVTDSYAIILELNELFVLEPVKENNNVLTIDTGRYMYKEKKDILVLQKQYEKVNIQ